MFGMYINVQSNNNWKSVDMYVFILFIWAYCYAFLLLAFVLIKLLLKN